MLKVPDPIRERGTVDLKITPAQYKKGWKNKKAKIACDYLSLTHEYYKTSIFNPSLNKIDCILQSTPTEFGFVPPSWCKIIDVEKTTRKNQH